MLNLEYKNFLISNIYSYSGKTQNFVIWKLDQDKNPYDLWIENFRSIKQAKKFIDQEAAK
jgi:hypothetical protein